MAGRRALALLLASIGAPALAGAGVTFENAWVRAPLPGQSVTAGYCDIANDGSRSVAIVGFAGDVRVELHETIHADGMARMRPLQSLAVAPHSTLSLAPGGKHLMLFGLDPAVASITLTAVFADRSEAAVTFAVRPLDAVRRRGATETVGVDGVDRRKR